MMLKLTAELKSRIADYIRLQTSASQVASIQATVADLDQVRSLLWRWTALYPALEPYFTAQQNDELRQQAAILHRRLSESKARFPTELNQHVSLARILGSARTLEERMQGYWTQYAAAKLQGPRERARFARLLPHMQPVMPEVDAGLAALERLESRLPAQPGDVTLFHTRLHQVDARLRNMAGIDPQQTAFLARLSSGTATLADISPALLEWCQREDLAPLLKLSL